MADKTLADISCPHSLALSLALMDLAASLFLGTDLVVEPWFLGSYRAHLLFLNFFLVRKSPSSKTKARTQQAIRMLV